MRFFWNALRMTTIFYVFLIDTYAGTTTNVEPGDVNGLIAAIRAANSEVPPFDGPDTINLAAGSVYTLTTGFTEQEEPESSGNIGLPTIATEITINGNGAIIQRAPSLFADGGPDDPCSGSGMKFRIFRVTPVAPSTSARLTLRNVTLRYGCASGTGSDRDGGAILNGGRFWTT